MNMSQPDRMSQMAIRVGCVRSLRVILFLGGEGIKGGRMVEYLGFRDDDERLGMRG